MLKTRIKIPKVNENEVVKISEGTLGFRKKVENRFEKIDNILFIITTSVVISCIAVVIAVIGLFLDQMRYNNAAYKDYFQKTVSIETTQKINQELLEQNKKNQEIIIELQKIILNK